MITIGLDFGTHQSKACVENKKGVELSYDFFKFKDNDGKEQYTLPSVIHINENDRLTYGYISEKSKGTIIKYFKQATFTNAGNGMSQKDATYYSIWYIANILFDIEEIYGQDFAIQIGVPSDGAHLEQQKRLAVRILLSAYRLVEEKFKNNKKLFLSSTLSDLKKVTRIVPYDEDKKQTLSILVFPEAYACLMPLIKSSKIAAGMSLMVDIGGGTTDISFFTIKDNKPQVYDFYSVNMGLNFLTDAENTSQNRRSSNVKDIAEIQNERKKRYENEINHICRKLITRLQKEFREQSSVPMQRLMDALKARPIIYSGGGSTFATLRIAYGGFQEIIHISEKEWRTEAISEINRIKTAGLCPILSTAYGLSINVIDDNIRCEPFKDIFTGLRDTKEDPDNSNIEQVYGGFSYDDYNAWK